ncbi:MAG TPA: phosphatidate cytidylyltransferase [bacterium]
MDLKKFGIRALVTIVFGPFILFCAWKGSYLFLALVTSLVVLGAGEFYGLAVKKVTNPQRILGMVASAALCLSLFFYATHYLWLVFAVLVFFSGTYELFRNAVNPILNIAATLMGVLCVALPLSFLLLIRELPNQFNFDYRHGGQIVILVFLTIWVCDTMAYVLGSQFGKHKLFERASPNKTIEGTLCGFLSAVTVAWVCQQTFLSHMRLVDVLVIGVISGSVGQMSDLLESLLKRDAGVKDSSNLIPGHGGILDRFDSEILVAPAVYVYLKLVVF